ncbi:peptide-methionine (S)-S-oxide reductase [Parapedobacter luteus]|uniref:Peptide methionine sulfoxide reductase MsrA n=1 Tax=Parapedobacter luteus TaxID=623280 RepID=A0A1T5BT62_9SPHI|nr:peptide-methionine (S)-S-oxide reductase MsrA [Parapedobacter luteus]SKB50070.1 peptide-methionine (S)-S-oxide reductase [Parapedobacter luteus]
MRILLVISAAMLCTACLQTANTNTSQAQVQRHDGGGSVGTDTATFAGGCFWCTEAQFQQLAGVDTVISGYTGGTVANPSYKQVTTGRTGHAEAVNVVYRPDVISYDELLEAFFIAHDPTQLNRQGNDIGPQYRSSIFYHDEEERKKAEYYIQRLNEERVYNQPIVTTLEPYTVFYVAEDYHQNYFNLNPKQAYCQYVIVPKLEKFKAVFKERLKR